MKSSIHGLLIVWLLLAAAMLPLQAEVSPASTNLDTATEQTLAVYKQMSLEELMNVDVTSVSRQPEPYQQAPASIVVITGDEIRRSGAASLPEALRLADNLDVAQKNSHDWSISARGFNTDLDNKLLVMIDGRTVYSPLFSGVFWDVQDYLLEDIDRIEVISGPGGTLWGANAVNGVINIISKSAKDTQGFYVEGGGGGYEQAFTGVRYGGTLASNVYFRVYGKYFDRGNEVFDNGKPASDSWQRGQGGFRIDDETSPQNTLTLQGDFYNGDEKVPNMTVNNASIMSGGNVLGRWSHTFSDNSDMSLQMYYDRTHLSVPKPGVFFEPAGILKDDLDTYDLDFQHRFPLGGRQQIVWGFGYRFTHDVVDDAPSVGFVPDSLQQNLVSGFVQDEILLTKDVYFTMGTKLEHNDYTGFEEEPSGRLQWNVSSNQMVWSAVSRAVRTPSRIDRELREPTGLTGPLASILDGGADFGSESVIAYELGYRAQLGAKFSGSASAFYNNYTDVRSVNATPVTTFPLFFGNDLEGHTYGLELSANYQMLDWWRLHGGYDLLKEQLHVKPGGADLANALNETADPVHQFNVRSSMDLPHHIELDATWRWVDQLIISNGGLPAKPAIVPSYCEMDLRVGWHPTDWLELSVVGQNLLHERHLEYGAPGAGREDITRSFYSQVVCRF